MKRMLAALFSALIAALAVFTGCITIETPEFDPPEEGSVDFSTTDINCEPISMAALSEKKVIMINFWESWCHPCVSEMPSIQALYEKYADRGFIVLGVYGQSEEEEIRAAVEKLHITYPVFYVTDSLKPYQTQYVPTTVFIDGSGRLLTDEPVVGSQSASDWESLILRYLDGE